MADFESVNQKAEKLVADGEFDKASNVCTQWISDNVNKNPRTATRKQIATMFNNRGRIKYLQVDFDKAELDYNSSIKWDATIAAVYYNRGIINYRVGLLQIAEADFEVALQLDPNFTECILALENCKKAMRS